MTTATSTKFLALPIAIVAFMLFVPTALSADFVGTASVTILESLSVSEEATVNFGEIHRPSEGTNTFTLHYQDGSVLTDGTGDASYVDGSAHSGHYLISGAPEHSIQVLVSIEDFGDSGISIDSAYVNGNTQSVSGSLDASGQYSAFVGGVITVSPEAALGTHTTDVVMTVTYE